MDCQLWLANCYLPVHSLGLFGLRGLQSTGAGFQAVRRRACTSRPDGGAHPWIVFDPIPRIDSVEPSNDSLLELCAAVYLLSGRRGRHAAG